MQKAEFWEMVDGNIDCNLCPHRCRIENEKFGVCKARKNIKNKLYTLTYGHPVASAVDPIEKKPLYHFLPGTKTYSIGTYGCNMGCEHCQNFDISQHAAEDGKLVKPKEIVKAAIKEGCQSISYTYNEPTIFFEYAYEIAVLARKAGLKNIIVTNGFISEQAARKFSEVMDAANVDIKAWNKKFYKRYCKASLGPVKEALRIYKKAGMWIECTNLVINGKNDFTKDIEAMAEWIAAELGRDTPLHLSRAYPMYLMRDIEPTLRLTLENAQTVSKRHLDYVYLGNVGLEQDTVCPKCSQPIIKRHSREVTLLWAHCSCGHTVSGIYGNRGSF